jgi:tetratricopeptide (TPR) repeat protein
VSIFSKSIKLFPVIALAVLLSACGNNSTSSADKKSAGSAEGAMSAQASKGLQAARQAFWQRDVATAEKQYRDLLDSGDASADTWGELGNVYYAQGKWQQAATAYAEAALRLIDKKQLGQAMHLHRLVMSLDGEQARRIDEKLRAEFTAQAAQ